MTLAGGLSVLALALAGQNLPKSPATDAASARLPEVPSASGGAKGSPLPVAEDNAPRHISNVVLVVLDGVRTEEFFLGTHPYARRRGRQHSRERLLPFLWRELAPRPDSFTFGDRFRQAAGQRCLVDNSYGISLPAYADILSGVRQTRVRTNKFTGRLAHATVPDRLLKEPGFAPQDIAIFASWRPIARVVSARPAPEFHIDTGTRPQWPRPIWKDARFDRDLSRGILNYLAERETAQAGPVRFLFAAFNDSDEWAHLGDYARYLTAIRRQDRYIRDLYNYLESRPAYAGRTLYIVTTDHGRGRGRHWKSHGRVPGSQHLWALIHAPGHPETTARYAALLQAECSHTALGALAYQAATDHARLSANTSK